MVSPSLTWVTVPFKVDGLEGALTAVLGALWQW